MEKKIETIKSKDTISWKLVEDVIIYITVIAISIPIFIILHRNLPELDWGYNLDRVLLYILMLFILLTIVRFTRKVYIILCIIFICFLSLESLKGGYNFVSLFRDYRAMIHSMRDSNKPQKILINRIAFNSSDAKILKAMDYTNPEVRTFALEATKKHFSEYQTDARYRTLIQCLAIFKGIRPEWNYVHDPKGQEYYAKASESIRTLSGDCDDYSILMAACIKVIGGTPRLVYTENHIYPELYIGGEKDLETINYLIKHELYAKESEGESLYYHIDEEGGIWLNMDYTASYPGGPYMNEEVIDIIYFD